MGLTPQQPRLKDPAFCPEPPATADQVAKVVNKINARKIWEDPAVQMDEDNCQNDLTEKINEGLMNVCIVRVAHSGIPHGIRMTCPEDHPRSLNPVPESASAPIAVDMPAAAPRGKGKQK
jgi:hypothetical protein